MASHQLRATMLSLLATGALAFAQGNLLSSRQTNAVPVMDVDFPDPSIFQTEDGMWHAWSTNGNDAYLPYATSPDFFTWTFHEGVDAFPELPPWVDSGNPAIWAPDVQQLDDGTFVLYFSATDAANPVHHCVGTATSSLPEGPFVAGESPWVCDIEQGGNIDASQFRDGDASRWVTYKVDGNSIGNGGSCGNTVEPIVPTPIMLQQVDSADGETKIGDPIQILDRDERDGPLVEGPAIAFSNGTYYLFFSSNCYSTTLYDVTFATASAVAGPYTKYGPLFVTGDRGLEAPGHADVSPAGTHLAWHGNCPAGRCMYTTTITPEGNTIIAD